MIGYGPLPRKEDARFIRGRGRFVDDVQVPGLLHGAELRSPLAHAEIVSIDASAALQHPRVHAVISGADLGGMAWIPTLSGDTQAVLATASVRFHGQEIGGLTDGDFTVTTSPHHPIGAKGIGESATVGSPPVIVNAICDALAPFGVRHVDMPCTPSRVWEAINDQG